MAEKTFSKIKEAEAQAQASIKNAREEAARIIRLAEEESADAFLQSSETYRRQASEKKRRTEAAAQARSLEFSKETTELCARLKQKLSLKKPGAVDAVIRAVTE